MSYSESHSQLVVEILSQYLNSPSFHNARLPSLPIKINFNLEMVPTGEHGKLNSMLHRLNFHSSSFANGRGL